MLRELEEGHCLETCPIDVFALLLIWFDVILLDKRKAYLAECFWEPWSQIDRLSAAVCISFLFTSNRLCSFASLLSLIPCYSLQSFVWWDDRLIEQSAARLSFNFPHWSGGKKRVFLTSQWHSRWLSKMLPHRDLLLLSSKLVSLYVFVWLSPQLSIVLLPVFFLQYRVSCPVQGSGGLWFFCLACSKHLQILGKTFSWSFNLTLLSRASATVIWYNSGEQRSWERDTMRLPLIVILSFDGTSPRRASTETTRRMKCPGLQTLLII